MSPDIDFDRYVGEMDVTKDWVFLDTAAVAPISNRARAAMQQAIDDVNRNAALNVKTWEKLHAETRELAARLLKRSPDEIAFVKNTSEGISHIANGLGFAEGDNIVTTNVEFPANIYPWWNLVRKGVSTRMVADQQGRVPFEEIERHLDDRTRVLALSSVEFSTGFRHDLPRLGALCRQRGIFFFVDAIQGLGALDIDAKAWRIDAAAADGHKWLVSPEGLGVLYIDRARLDEIKVTEIGWTSVVNARDFLTYDSTLKPDASRFEPGSLNTVAIAALNASLTLLLQIGIPNIERHVLALTDYLCERLQQKKYVVYSSRRDGEKSAIVSFASPRHDATAIYKTLRDRRIIVALRDGRLRASPHFFNTRAHIDTLIEALPA